MSENTVYVYLLNLAVLQVFNVNPIAFLVRVKPVNSVYHSLEPFPWRIPSLSNHTVGSDHVTDNHKGRSPYEAPERPTGPTAEPERPTQRRVSPLHADGYAQHYDERGHPVNPESKSFGRELRRAKNDILSTMGIVVSEEGGAAGPSEQQKIEMIAAENDYGLVMATLDQISVFLGSWWTSSVTGRIQVNATA